MIPLLFAAVPESTAEHISVEVALLVVLGGTLAFCLKLLADTRSRLARLLREKKAATPPPADTAGTAVGPQIVAAICAAICETFGPDHQVTMVRPLDLSGTQPWSLEGRREVFHSHQPR